MVYIVLVAILLRYKIHDG